MSAGININLAAPPAGSSYGQKVMYKECRRNHAASLGRVAYDGCLEFLEGGLRGDDNNTRDDMLCAACGCHRSFHRKVTTLYNVIPQTHHIDHETLPHNNTVNATASPPPAASGSRVQQLEAETMPMPMPMPMPVAMARPPSSKRKKRTLFTAEQKNRMMMFAERLGWRPQKGDKELIEGFCMEMGISRRMFLVWLSNNRRRAMQQINNATTDPTPTTTTTTTTTTTGGGGEGEGVN